VSNQLIIEEVAKRLRTSRLNADISQAELAERSGLGIVTIKRAESGKGNTTLLTLIAILRALGKIDQIDTFLPEPPVSPLLLLKSQGVQRQRASSKKYRQADRVAEPTSWIWGDKKT
jgi:transcriptional regulator with XRE-family HTH domain